MLSNAQKNFEYLENIPEISQSSSCSDSDSGSGVSMTLDISSGCENQENKNTAFCSKKTPLWKSFGKFNILNSEKSSESFFQTIFPHENSETPNEKFTQQENKHLEPKLNSTKKESWLKKIIQTNSAKKLQDENEEKEYFKKIAIEKCERAA
eukprot:Sdes_comp15945_c0_seq1m5092